LNDVASLENAASDNPRFTKDTCPPHYLKTKYLLGKEIKPGHRIWLVDTTYTVVETEWLFGFNLINRSDFEHTVSPGIKLTLSGGAVSHVVVHRTATLDVLI
jgi:hypothetical protein